MIILDTDGLSGFLDVNDAHHDAARVVVDADPGLFVLSPFVLADTDHLVHARLGVEAECAFLDDIADGVYTLAAFGGIDMTIAASVVRQYADLGIGVADASVAVVAARHHTVDILSIDERSFRAMRPLAAGEAFRLLPFDD